MRALPFLVLLCFAPSYGADLTTIDMKHFCLLSLQTSREAKNILQKLALHYAPPSFPEQLSARGEPENLVVTGRARSNTDTETSLKSRSGPLRKYVLKKNEQEKTIRKKQNPTIEPVKHSLMLNTLLADIYRGEKGKPYAENAYRCITHLQSYCHQERDQKQLAETDLDPEKQKIATIFSGIRKSETESLQKFTAKYVSINKCQQKQLVRYDPATACTNAQIADDTITIAKILFENPNIIAKDHILFDVIELVLYYGMEVISNTSQPSEKRAQKIANIDQTRQYYELKREHLPPALFQSLPNS